MTLVSDLDLAIMGVLSCFGWCIAFFLPWIVFPQAERERIHQAIAPEVGPGNGGIKGKRPNKKDKLRAAAKKEEHA